LGDLFTSGDGVDHRGLSCGSSPTGEPLGAVHSEEYETVLFGRASEERKPEPAITPEENTVRMQKHLAYSRSQAEAGKFVLVGPLTEDNRIRGIAVIQAASLEEAQRIASGDPVVQSGHLNVEVHPILLEDLSGVRFDYPSLQ